VRNDVEAEVERLAGLDRRALKQELARKDDPRLREILVSAFARMRSAQEEVERARGDLAGMEYQAQRLEALTVKLAREGTGAVEDQDLKTLLQPIPGLLGETQVVRKFDEIVRLLQAAGGVTGRIDEIARSVSALQEGLADVAEKSTQRPPDGSGVGVAGSIAAALLILASLGMMGFLVWLFRL